MTYKQFRLVRVAMAIILAMIMSQAVITNNYLLAATAIGIGVIIILILRHQVTEVIADERDYEVAGQAARYALMTFSILTSVAVFVLISLRQVNPLYEAIGSALAYAVCTLLLLYSLIFGYMQKAVPLGKRFLFIAATIVLALMFTALGLRLFSQEDTWLCQDGQWVKHGQPSSPPPTEACDQ